MPELVERGHIYIAQPPLYKVKRGKQEQYVKDDNALEAYLIQLALDGSQLHLDADSPAISGEALESLLQQYNSARQIISRLARRYDHDVLSSLLFEPMQAASEELSADAYFTWVDNAIKQLNTSMNGERLYKVAFRKEDDKQWAIEVSRRQHGLDHVLVLDQGLFLTPELKLLMRVNQELDGLLAAGAYIQRGERKQEVQRFDAVASWLMREANRGLTISRYKGLGEMNPDQLWETTMDPSARRLMQVRIEDAIGADQIFTTLMGDQVEPRREFIESNALAVENLDI
jgi:DNA gyrase subunit B